MAMDLEGEGLSMLNADECRTIAVAAGNFNTLTGGAVGYVLRPPPPPIFLQTH